MIDRYLASLSAQQRALVSFAQRLVATPSPPGEEHAVSELLVAECRSLGFDEISVDRSGNVLATLGSGPPQLLINGHLDHVPPAGMPDPYEASIVEGDVWMEDGPALRGRGSSDMKANVAAAAYAAAVLREAGARMRGSVILAADVREEEDSHEGLPTLLERGLWAEHGLSVEATRLDVALGHRGKVQFDVIVQGRASHAARPDEGENAVYRALPILTALERARLRAPLDPIFGPPTLTVTRVETSPGGDVAVVPDSCTIRVDRRYVPGETPASCHRELDELVSAVARAEGVRAKVVLVGVYPLMEIATDHPLVEHATCAVTDVCGRQPSLVAWRFGVNATFASAAGIPCVGIGPGDERFAHTAEEHVPVQELLAAARIYAELIVRLCS